MSGFFNICLVHLSYLFLKTYTLSLPQSLLLTRIIDYAL